MYSACTLLFLSYLRHLRHRRHHVHYVRDVLVIYVTYVSCVRQTRHVCPHAWHVSLRALPFVTARVMEVTGIVITLVRNSWDIRHMSLFGTACGIEVTVIVVTFMSNSWDISHVCHYHPYVSCTLLCISRASCAAFNYVRHEDLSQIYYRFTYVMYVITDFTYGYANGICIMIYSLMSHKCRVWKHRHDARFVLITYTTLLTYLLIIHHVRQGVSHVFQRTRQTDNVRHVRDHIVYVIYLRQVTYM